MKKIVLYGVGSYLKSYLADFENVLDNVLMIVDGSNEKVGKKFHGFEIKSKEELRDISDEVIIAIASETYYECIKGDIKEINSKLKCLTLTDALLKIYTPIGYCNLCKTSVGFWRRIGEKNKTVYTIIGNGQRRGGCPVCGSYDRNRWQYYVIKNYTELLNQKSVVLHFAPEYPLLSKIKENIGTKYYTADIQEGRADYVVDITNIKFEEKKFDYIIANHVLEHITNERKAISELIRCLKDNGIIILSFPVTMETKTLENCNHISEEDRIKYYGQKDHVRLYGNDYIDRLERYGLNVEALIPNELLDKQTIIMNGFIENDIMLLCTKRQTI
ncbi:MAG TPA: class I SAM-dependent methyltransferase [Clostridiales bacterium]|nr:class I SAM-dependent methyltransferase [Clostridiales bacterium]